MRDISTHRFSKTHQPPDLIALRYTFQDIAKMMQLGWQERVMVHVSSVVVVRIQKSRTRSTGRCICFRTWW